MLKDNIQSVIKELKNGNNLGEHITLVAAVKTQSAELINEAVKLGITDIGENRVQEFVEKHDLINGASRHFIGHLQSNKVKYLIGKVDLIHSVDSVALAKIISDRSLAKGLATDILLQVNIGSELSKSGFDIGEVLDVYGDISDFEGVRVKGLMAMLPISNDQIMLAELCLQMRGVYDKIRVGNSDIEHLSLGMTSDYKIAIQNGSNMVRIGSLIFGKRNYT